MQSEAMMRSGAMAAPATMQSEAMMRSGAMAAPATMQSEAMMRSRRRGGRSDDEERRG
jgi:hypothetical protein